MILEEIDITEIGIEGAERSVNWRYKNIIFGLRIDTIYVFSVRMENW